MDKVGAFASAACAVHCLLTGIAFSVLSVTGLSFLGSEAAEISFFSVAMVVGSFAIYSGFKKHRSCIPAAIFCFAIMVLILAHAVPAIKASLLGTVLAVSGGLILVAFHLVNHRLPKRCECEHCQARADSKA